MTNTLSLPQGSPYILISWIFRATALLSADDRQIKPRKEHLFIRKETLNIFFLFLPVLLLNAGGDGGVYGGSDSVGFTCK